MKRETIKNLLAAVGALFIAILVLSFILTLGNEDSGIAFGDKVGVIEVSGIIVDSSEVTGQIDDFIERDDIKAVVLRIDSPGGAVGPSQEIYSEVRRLKESKKVVASMGSVAASGGYYIAAGADRIVANPGTITGSIGVIVEFMNVEGLFSKVGLKGETIKSGRYKDTGSPLRQMNEEERVLVQSVVDDVHGQFVSAVADGRGMDVEAVRKIADGRILSGAQAKGLGLIDELGTLRDAVRLVAGLAGMEAEPPVVYAKKRRGDFWSALFGEGAVLGLSDLKSGFRIMYLARPL